LTEITYRGKPVKKIEFMGEGSSADTVFIRLTLGNDKTTMLFELEDMNPKVNTEDNRP
jgi:hypothetical protein